MAKAAQPGVVGHQLPRPQDHLDTGAPACVSTFQTRGSAAALDVVPFLQGHLPFNRFLEGPPGLCSHFIGQAQPQGSLGNVVF